MAKKTQRASTREEAIMVLEDKMDTIELAWQKYVSNELRPWNLKDAYDALVDDYFRTKRRFIRNGLIWEDTEDIYA